jgi:hypothetical protein
MPELTPVIDPVKETVAMLLFVLYQKPPGVASLNEPTLPVHNVVVPDIAAIVGTVITVTVMVLVRPPISVYEIVTVPAATPVTIPEDVPTVAIVLSLLLQVPPLAASVRAVVAPAQTVVVPVIGDAGTTFTVVTAVDEPQLLVIV